MAEISIQKLKYMKKDVIIAHQECSQRGLLQGAKWAAELSYALDCTVESLPIVQEAQEFGMDFDRYTLAKSYFDLREYDRAAYFLKTCTAPKAYFLHMYSRYQAGEKRRIENTPETLGIGPRDENDCEHLKVLREELSRKHQESELDGYCLYLYGVILKKLELLREAVDVFVAAVNKEPLYWGSWLELALLITDKEMLNSLSLPDHWMKKFFTAHAYLELQLNEEALKLYHALSESGFSRSTYVMSQIALTHHNIRDVDSAVEAFAELPKIDPYRLENMDTFSNLLYVKEMKTELAYLAHRCCEIDKYRVETCCVIGNFYSLRGQHEKSLLYFRRALKLNPNYLSAWTLMGHEYMEIKNTHAAIQAYRQAIEVNRRDYRAWYGLGQTYEILKMYTYCLYYYRKAQMLRPNDSRMVVALGEIYEKVDRLQEAKKCFWKAHSLGDVEGLALIKLAKLYERLNEEVQAAAAYTEYINECEGQGLYNTEEQSQAYKYLANYHIRHGSLDDAYIPAQKCTEYNETKEEGKALLRQISRQRALGVEQTSQAGLPGSAERSQIINSQGSTPVLRLAPTNLSFTPG